jgi:hypothetical protein
MRAAAAAATAGAAELSRYAGPLGRFAMKHVISWAPFAVTVQVRKWELVFRIEPLGWGAGHYTSEWVWCQLL